jgi:2-oxoisovalerate dehydrogenase E1 component
VAANGFWAALNMATVLHLPLLFSIEDNEYGLSVPGDCQTPGGNIAANLACFPNLATFDGDGADPAEAAALISAAVAHVRDTQRPALLRLRVPRLLGHTYVDDQAYKPADKREAEEARDPLPRLRQYLLDQGHLTAAAWDELRDSVRAHLQHAVELARKAPEPDPATATDHLFFDGKVPDVGGLRREHAQPAPGDPTPHPDGPRINLVDAVRRTLEAEMLINRRILVFGEDVGVKGGVHGATRGMQAQFGWERVFDTSLSEEGIVGRALGMALAGLMPVPEIQFRKYADPATEQINDIGTLRWRTAGKFSAPMVIRIPVGHGKVTGDPWHSVSGEAILAHTLGWRVAMPSNAEDAVGLLRTALRGDDPTLFLEHRALLDTAIARRPYPGDDYALPFGLATHLLEGDELTVVTWGAMVHRCLDAAGAFPGRIDLLDLRTVIPWDRDAVLASVARTGKLLVVHEDTRTAGFAGEIIATVAGQAFTDLDGPLERLATPDAPIPYNIAMMNAMLPTVETIRARMQSLLEF